MARLQDVYILKTSSRRIPDVFKTSWKTKNSTPWKTRNYDAEDVFKTSSRHVLKTSSKHALKSSSRRLEDRKMFPG